MLPKTPRRLSFHASVAPRLLRPNVVPPRGLRAPRSVSRSVSSAPGVTPEVAASHEPFTRSFTTAAPDLGVTMPPSTAEPVLPHEFPAATQSAAACQQAPHDAARFKQHHSVDFWSRQAGRPSLFSASEALHVRGQTTTVGDVAAEVGRHLTSGKPKALLYWSYHVARHLFFLFQALCSLIAHRAFGTASTVDASGSLSTASSLEAVLKSGGSHVSSRLAEAVATFAQDWEAIQSGTYKLPWDMTTVLHPQYNPLNVLVSSASFVQEAVAALDRKSLQQVEKPWLQSPLYPPYYNSTYHYQTDGWLSSRSADIYEFSTEALFMGRQDAMQRTTLLPLAAYLAGRDASQLQLLEVAAGTGRFHTFIKDNWPELQTTVTELSPFYLQRARANMQLWKRLRAAKQELGGVDNIGTRYFQCPAEALAAEPESQDVVVCVYLFHELPPESREAAAREMFRVLKPGGLAVLTDSVQLGDRPFWDASLHRFENYNEPQYNTYITCDLGALFEGAGFACDTKYLSSASKTLSFLKPVDSTAGGPLSPPA